MINLKELSEMDLQPTICDICDEYCENRGDGTVHSIKEGTFCSCCIRWFHSCDEKASRTINLREQKELILVPGELLRIADDYGWAGFIGAEYLMMMAQTMDDVGEGSIQLGDEVASVDFTRLDEATADALGDCDPPEGYCPLRGS